MNTSSVILVHYGELILKGKNRKWFESRLESAVSHALNTDALAIHRDYGRMVIREKQEGYVHANRDEIIAKMSRVYGVANFYVGTEVPARLESIEEEVFKQLDSLEFESFGVRTKRSSRQFPITSGEIDRRIGAAVVERFGSSVDLTDPDMWVSIRIQDATAIIATTKHVGAGGLPYGTSGRMLTMLSSGIDSPVAAHTLMKRGATMRYVHFHSYPLTTRDSEENAFELARTLHAGSQPSIVYSVPLAAIQREIAAKTPSRLRVLLYRRAMFQIAERLSKQIGAKAIVTGESLGQVASQTIENITAATHGIEMPVLRPLIGMDKQEIISIAQRIGTYETSIQPYQDCCSLLVPDSVETKARLDEVLEAQELIDWNALIEEVVNGIEQTQVV